MLKRYFFFMSDFKTYLTIQISVFTILMIRLVEELYLVLQISINYVLILSGPPCNRCASVSKLTKNIEYNIKSDLVNLSFHRCFKYKWTVTKYLVTNSSEKFVLYIK